MKSNNPLRTSDGNSELSHKIQYSNAKLDDHDHCSPIIINTCVNDKSSGSNVFIWQGEKREEYQLALQNEQTCHAFSEMLCAVTDRCNIDTLCDMFNGMLENIICPLFTARKHAYKQKNYIKKFSL